MLLLITTIVQELQILIIINIFFIRPHKIEYLLFSSFSYEKKEYNMIIYFLP